MDRGKSIRLLMHLRDSLCVLSLIVFVALEGYFADVLISGGSEFSTSSERVVGRVIVSLDCALVIGVVLLLGRKRRKLGFCLVALSLLLYTLLVCWDDSHWPGEHSWMFDATWLLLSAIGIIAARTLMNRSTRDVRHLTESAIASE
jgi:hypothetical protein